MGSKFTLASSFTADTGKLLTADAVLPTQGAVLLIDGNHSAGGFGVGVPANTQVLPNIAWAQAAAMLGSGSQNSLSPVMTFGATQTGLGFERTLKGALHGAINQTALVNGQGRALYHSPDMKTLLFANKAHKFYMSMWGRITRAAVGPVTQNVLLFGIGANTLITNYIALFLSTSHLPAATDGQFTIGAAANALGMSLRGIAVPTQTGTMTEINNYFSVWGAFGPYGTALAGAPDDAPSWALYRAYIEDLTVSGRTYAQVAQLDQALYAKEFAAGGKFADDTWTAPATLAGS